jgi:hypothetical protein
MSPSAKIIGVHPVKAKEPCHLIEIVVYENIGPLDMAEFTQPWQGKSQASWQVAYDEVFLESDGTEMPLAWMIDLADPNFWRRNVRFSFFFHYLDLERPLQTPFGEVRLLAPTPRPERLAFIKYSRP